LGSCWANPETPFGTHWFVESCFGDLSASLFHALAVTENLSYNYDFLDNDLYTWVRDSAYVYQTEGFPGWATFSDDWGEASELIFGITLLGYSVC